MARKDKGRFEAEAHLKFAAAPGMTAQTGATWQIGLNFSRLLDEAYTFRRSINDTGRVEYQEWEDRAVTFAYLQTEAYFGRGRLAGETLARAEIALPNSEARFSKISGRAEMRYRLPGMLSRLQGNLGTSFGPDRLPLQDAFRGEGADARTRYRHDKAETFGDLSGIHRLVEGGGNLRGYTGTPLWAEKYATFNFELGPSATVAGFSLFGFYDRGLIWPTRDANSLTRANAGVALSFGGSSGRLFGANLLSELALRVYFPFWLSHPLSGEKQQQFRWYFALGKSL
jgi:hypothetical protein